MSELPPGFVLDAPAAAPMPSLPGGFVLDQAGPAAPDNRSFLGRVGDRVTDIATGLANVRMSDIVKGVAHSASSAVTLPGDVAAGKVDPLSPQGFERVQDLAGFASPLSAGAASRMAVEKAVPQIARDASEAGITLTAGQRTGSPALLSREDSMFGGGLGPKAQEVAQAARTAQQGEVLAARDAIGDVAGRNVAQLERPSEAGGIVADAMKDRAAAAKQDFRGKYDQAFSSEGVMKPQAFEGLSGRISESLVSRAEPVIIDDVLTPAANRALKELDNIQNLKLGTIGQPAAGEEIAGVNLRGVDQARRKLNAFYSATKQNPADRRAVGGIINEFDNAIEKAVQDGLFSGDEAFLGTLKEARAAYSSYQKTFKPQGGGDDVGRAMQKIVERDATPEQVANYLYGSAKVGATPLSVRLADRIKGIVGEDSPHWAAIRQGAWQKLTGVAEGRTEMGAQKMSERILEFTNGEGRSLATRLFSADEIAQMNRFATIQKAIAAKAGTTNPSNSGNRLAALARESLASVASMLGATMSGPQGAAAGYATGKAISSIGAARSGSQARQLFSGAEPIPIGTRAADITVNAGKRLALPAAQQLLIERR